MERSLNRLSPKTVENLSEPGSYLDGGGLRLQISKSGTKSWLFRYKLGGRSREMGLGSFPTVTLKAAREKADAARKLLADGTDPLNARDEVRAAAVAAEVARKVEEAKRRTFQDFAEEYVASQERGWRNPAKLATLWRGTLVRYVYPELGHLPISAIDTPLVLRIIQPLWGEKTETAQRIRMRLEAILAAATVLGYREGPNPAQWRNNLDRLLPAARKVAKVAHHPALPYREIGDFVAVLRGRDAPAARALELVILTAVRTSEALEAEWSEIDLKAKIWTIPEGRTKMDRAHRVPLSDAAVAVIEKMAETRRNKYVFPSIKEGRPLSNMAMLTLLKRMERTDITVHGFRSSFRDWCSEQTSFPHEVCEMALAHTIKNQAERAYRRGDLLDKRRALMDQWAIYCGTPSIGVDAKVTSIRRKSVD